MKYYKVLSAITKATLIDTQKSNYSQTLPHFTKFQKLLDYAVSSSEKDELGLDLYFVLNNCLATEGKSYLERLLNSLDNDVFSLASITQNENHKGKFVSKPKIVEIINSLIGIGLPVFENGSYLWEYLYESVRKENFSNLPNRLNSFFLFESITDCEYFIQNHKGVGYICEVEIIETQSIFCGDMYLLDTIPNHATSKEVKLIAQEYWQGKKTSTPIIEVIFQGKCKIKPMYKLIKMGNNLVKI